MDEEQLPLWRLSCEERNAIREHVWKIVTPTGIAAVAISVLGTYAVKDIAQKGAEIEARTEMSKLADELMKTKRSLDDSLAKLDKASIDAESIKKQVEARREELSSLAADYKTSLEKLQAFLAKSDDDIAGKISTIEGLPELIATQVAGTTSSRVSGLETALQALQSTIDNHRPAAGYADDGDLLKPPSGTTDDWMISLALASFDASDVNCMRWIDLSAKASPKKDSWTVTARVSIDPRAAPQSSSRPARAMYVLTRR